MTPRQLEILQHALGANKYGKWDHRPESGIPIPPRNYFAAGADDEPTCRDLVAMGYMREHRTTEVFSYYNCSVTDAGRAAMHRESPAPPKLTRSQIRYRHFLSWADAYGGTFREYLADMKQRSAALPGGAK